MRPRSRLLWTFCLLLPLTFACNRSSHPSVTRDGTVLQSPEAGGRVKSDRVFAGHLRSVDPSRRILIVEFGDDLYEFAYDNATEIVGGTANVQGLAGNTGDQITVHYREHPITSTKTAVRIELQ
jgi:hypothetical protein